MAPGGIPMGRGSGVATLTLVLTGDVMPGRGVDQALPVSVAPILYERYVADAREYVALAERAHGPIGAPLQSADVWGDALPVLASARVDARIVNLETALTTCDVPWPGKRVHYRMHPANVELLTQAGIEVAVLANNHVLDWSRAGLRETLAVLDRAGIASAGAGTNLESAWAPAAVATRRGRLLVFAAGFGDAGIPAAWQAGPGRPGVALVRDTSRDGADALAAWVLARRRPGDRVIVSLHWGPNWGYDVPAWQRGFAHRLIDVGAADVVHGHSSHHPKGIEVHEGRAILYGAGDLLNDYEGIRAHASYRPDLSLLYLPTLDAEGALVSLELVPLRTRRFRLGVAPPEDARWLATAVDRASGAFGVDIEPAARGRWMVRWR